MTSNTSTFVESLLRVVTSALLVVFFCVLFYRPIEIEDIGWHLSTGRWIVEQKQVPHEDPFSFQEEKSPWVFTQWLGSTSYYLVYKAGGNQGLKIYRDLLFILILTIFFIYARKKIPLSLLLLILMIFAFGLRPRSLLRPFVYNYIFIQIFLIQLLSYQKTLDLKKLIVLPLLGIVWFNLHLGSFLYGSIIFAIFILISMMTFFESKLNHNNDLTRVSIRQMKGFIGTYIAFVFLFIVNPYGLEGALYPFKVFLLPTYINIYKFVDLISEAKPPLYLLSIVGLWFYVLCLLAIIGLIINKTNKITYTLLFVIPLAFYLYGDRASVFFVSTVVYVIAGCADGISLKQKWSQYKHARTINIVLYLVLIFLLCCFTVNKYNRKINVDGKTVRYDAQDYAPKNPYRAMEFLKANNIKGNVFNSDLWGGHIIWSSYPDLKPIVDGRQLNQDVFGKYFETLIFPQKFFDWARRDFKFKIVILDASLSISFKIVKYLAQNPKWQLVFIHGSSVVFVERGAFELSVAIDQLEDHLNLTKLSAQEKDILKTVKAQKTPFPWKEIYNPKPSYIDVLEEGVTLFEMGYHNAGIKKSILAYQLSDQKMTRAVIEESNEILKNSQ